MKTWALWISSTWKARARTQTSWSSMQSLCSSYGWVHNLSNNQPLSTWTCLKLKEALFVWVLLLQLWLNSIKNRLQVKRSGIASTDMLPIRSTAQLNSSLPQNLRDSPLGALWLRDKSLPNARQPLGRNRLLTSLATNSLRQRKKTLRNALLQFMQAQSRKRFNKMYHVGPLPRQVTAPK